MKERKRLEQNLDYSKMTDQQLIDLEHQYSNAAARFDSLQLAQKILMNSLYGALGAGSFRYFDLNLASSITLSGQHAIKWIERKLNELLDQKTGFSKDRVVLIDTDSVVLEMDDMVKKFCPQDVDRETKLQFIDRFGEAIIHPYIEASYSELADYMNAFENRLRMKRENIINTMVSVAAKSYVMEVYNSEGVQYTLQDPYMKIMGLLLVKSSTPAVIRDALRNSLPILLHGTESDMQQYVDQVKKKFYNFPVEQIAFPRGITNLSIYDRQVVLNQLNKTTDPQLRAKLEDSLNTATKQECYVKKTPVHVRGSLIYNMLLDRHGLTQQYKKIGDGDKVKFVYLKTPNPIKEDCIAFQDNLPEQFGLNKYIDYDKMFTVAFLQALEKMIEPLKWSSTKKNDLSSLFKW